MTHSPLVSLALGALLIPSLALAQTPDFETDLALAGTAVAGQRPGVDFPMLEFDSRFGVLTSKARILLHQGGRTEVLGVLDQNLVMSTHGAYRFRGDAEDSPEKARVNFLDFSADVGVKIALEHPRVSTLRRGAEMGRIRQRALFSIGTGIDVYEKGSFDREIGYIDQKAAATFTSTLIRQFGTFGLHTPDKIYTFYKVEHREVANTGFRVSRLWSSTRSEAVKTPLFHFTTGTATGSGPGGVFLDTSGRPLLAIKGDWWVSQNIFDLLVRRADAEGTAGKVLRGIGTIAELLDDDPTNDGNSLDGANDFVRNPSAYLGSFLIGTIYFQEFRDAVGIRLPLPAIQ